MAKHPRIMSTQKIRRSQGATITTPQVTANDRPLTNYLVLHSGPPMLKIPMPENTSYSFIQKYQYSLSLIP